MSEFADQAREELHEDEDAKAFVNIKAIIAWVLSFFFLLLLGLSQAHAADFGCGVDTDRSGGAPTTSCPAPDADHDGYPTTGYTGPWGSGIDCDDGDFFLHPGETTTGGCTATNYRTCNSDGSFSACSAIASFSCKTGTGVDIWVDPAGVTTAGCGANGSPCAYTCIGNTGLACSKSLAAGDCVIFKHGTYSGSSYTSLVTGTQPAQIEINAKTGTVTNPIVLTGEPGVPGTYPKITGAGTSTTAEMQGIIYVFQSPYVTVKDLELDGTGGYQNSGIHVDGNGVTTAGFVAHDMYIHNIKGQPDNNLSAIKCRQNTSGCTIHHILSIDNCDTTGGGDPTCGNQNNVPITIMDDVGAVSITDNVIGFGAAQGGGGIRIKHASDTSTVSIKRNIVSNAFYGIGTENKDTTVSNNWVMTCTNNYGLQLKTIGDSNGWFKNESFTYNTIQNCGALNIAAYYSEALNHPSFTTTISDFNHNVVVDNNASYDGDGGDGFMRIDEYGSDTEYTDSRGKLLYSNNCYYNAATNLRFGDFARVAGDGGPGPAGNLGTSYTDLPAWQAAGYDSGSFQETPSLSSAGVAAAAHCTDKGWNVNMFTAAASSTGTTTSSNTYNTLRRRRR